MKRIPIKSRNNWQSIVERQGFKFHTEEGIPYWDESAYYEFTPAEITSIKAATLDLWTCCLEVVDHVINHKLYDQFCIPEFFIPHIEKSWRDQQLSFYGRFDLCHKRGQLKMLEFNADTPTSLFEASNIQHHWLTDTTLAKDQCNDIFAEMIYTWSRIAKTLKGDKTLYFTCKKDILEDTNTIAHLSSAALLAGIESKFINYEDIGWDENKLRFVDRRGYVMFNIFKLYPYECLVNDPFGPNIVKDTMQALWIEPSWKMILSNKASLALLWKMFPNHPNLLECYFEPKGDSYAKKPFFSRQGAGIELYKKGKMICDTDSSNKYDPGKYVYQELCELQAYDGNYPVIGSWVIGHKPAGIGIRESRKLITDHSSRFVPHLIY